MKVSGVRMTHRGAMGVNSDGRRTGRLRRGLYVGQKTINGKKYTVFGKDMTEARARLNALERDAPKARAERSGWVWELSSRFEPCDVWAYLV